MDGKPTKRQEIMQQSTIKRIHKRL